MMFLQFFIFGAWYVTVGNYMAAEGKSDLIHWAYTVGPVAAFISPFFLGRVADRFFAIEKVLAGLNLCGGLAMWAATLVGASSGWLFISCLLLHSLCFFPTIGLTSTLTFHNISYPEKQFPLIRVWGSIGWVLAGLLVSLVLSADESVLPLQIAAVTSFTMGAYCFSLPHTPPKAKSSGHTFRDILGLDTLKHLNTRPFMVFIICELLIASPLSMYYAYAPVYVNAVGIGNPAWWMSFGQTMEVLVMFLMPLVMIRFGVKQMIIIGFAAWVLRFVLLAFSAPDGTFGLIIAGILLHGICFDFVYIAGQIFLDRQVTPDMRGQAQGLLVMLQSGVGMAIGAQVAGWIFNVLMEGDPLNLDAWRYFWGLPAVAALIILICFALFFTENHPKQEKEGPNV